MVDLLTLNWTSLTRQLKQFSSRAGSSNCAGLGIPTDRLRNQLDQIMTVTVLHWLTGYFYHCNAATTTTST